MLNVEIHDDVMMRLSFLFLTEKKSKNDEDDDDSDSSNTEAPTLSTVPTPEDPPTVPTLSADYIYTGKSAVCTVSSASREQLGIYVAIRTSGFTQNETASLA